MALTYDKLTPEAAQSALANVRDWAIIEGALTKTFTFENYKDGLLFSQVVGYTAESLNHHPDMLVSYGKVVVSMVTHDAGGGLTAYDFELARRIDVIS